MRFEYGVHGTIMGYIIFLVGGKMKKYKEINHMIQKIKYIDIAIFTIILIAFIITKNTYIVYLQLGYIVSIINFYINIQTVTYVFSQEEISKNHLIAISYFLRAMFAAVIGVILFVHNKFSVVPYVLGYNIHYLSIMIYSLKNRDERV